MKRIAVILLALCTLLLTGCKGHSYKDIEITSFKLVSITPEGLSSITALIEVGLHNPTVGFEVSDVEGVARYKGQEAVMLSADRVVVDGRSDKTYSFPVKCGVAKGFSVLRLMALAAKESEYENVTVSVSAKLAMRGGVGKVIEINDMPLTELLGK